VLKSICVLSRKTIEAQQPWDEQMWLHPQRDGKIMNRNWIRYRNGLWQKNIVEILSAFWKRVSELVFWLFIFIRTFHHLRKR